ncbi:NFX1-type zinc finger-containing protein 1-like [Eublepharis macularius]|uniref:NFX1-type zinc finger-containing protein 1-like n=1 Tax=Eublepharis macularius TaxID=481883 RepID=A0AA97JNI3_EUBMA|nr:NFX1-type zinc finger-containing protein 1-like [Eublepharis macularius]XP_054840651.1 NFX1-type zinc finger-containing protein 1-like [Eublepharis macularius]XP_054840652.1 NFX1-type zinc finger-containing protein 1-like [Eublepharis macularius]XP_054840653.1 NFX1-type zinc finger-containing protein 1-like [Eublepharis macularius]
MSGLKRRWRDLPGRGPSPPPHKALRLSPEPGPSRGQDSCSILEDLDRLGNHNPEQLLAFLKAHTALLERALGSPGLSPHQVRAVLHALRCVTKAPLEPQEVQPVLLMVLQPPFMLQSLLGYIAHLETFCCEDGRISQEVVGDVVVTLHHLLTAFPGQARTLLCYPMDLLYATIQRLQSRGFQFTWITQKWLWDTKFLLDKAFPNQGELRSGSLASPASREDFHLIPVFPTPEDIFLEPTWKLKPNIIVGKYRSDAAYLDTHFRLLREDLVKPLRDGISAQFTLQNLFSGSEKVRGELLLYQNVWLVQVGASPSGVMYLAKYVSKQKAAPVSSKRLLSGSLVCLISNDSHHVLFGTVAGCNRKELPHGAVWLDLKHSHRSLQGHVGRTCFTMVESPAFFEAYRYVLEGLQEVVANHVPFRRYIVQCDLDISRPAYLEGEALPFDLSALRSLGSKCGLAASSSPQEEAPLVDLTAVSPFCSPLWTPETFPGLDESQILAIRMALSREFVLIQGPPGTGKTFIGLKILEVLLANQALWNKDCTPCLVVCYTNHALDQFLEGILKFQRSGVVRIGGRSKNQAVASCSLRNVRKQSSGFLLFGEKQQYGRMLGSLRRRKGSIACCTELLELLPRGILTGKELEAEITEDHLWVPEGGLLQWLKIYPPKEEVRPRRHRSCRRPAGTELLRYDKDERFLDDDYSDDDEKVEDLPGLKSKFAYILPAKESPSQTWMKSCLTEGDIMSSEEVSEIQDLWALRLRDRWRLYRRWVAAYRNKLVAVLVEKLEVYEKDAAQLQELTFQEDLKILQHSRVIGMTTTGAAKYRKLLQNIRPRIVVVEEAAEILEAHVLTALTSSCQHLILIGDHQQLRPKPADYTLERKHFLGISLFERMINNHLPYVQLLYQHRMRPEISQLLVPLFYRELQDHAVVLDYEKIKGVERSIFFVQHREEESRSVDSESYSNLHEASFLVSLTSYLLKQGYAESQITILTPYHGQVMKIRTLLKKQEMEAVAAHTVDDFQGEENNIVLLSLVRSNSQRKIGFLQDKNRLCVALSRAKLGFYCIGNLGCISASSKLWKEFTLLLKSKNLLGEELTLMCQNHPETKTAVKATADFSKLPDGGCTLKCQTRLECGHPCTRRCHPCDTEHRTNTCEFPCSKSLCAFSHKCPRKCGESCEPCSVKVEKVIPKCGHSQMVPCHVPAHSWVCEELCQQLLECNHPCKLRCGQDCRARHCRETVQVTLPCSHSTQTDCFRQKMPLLCYEKCKQRLECGHRCQGSCYKCLQGRMHAACRRKCTRVLLCSHVCQGSCCENCPPCGRKCLKKCRHSHCGKSCGEVCFSCKQPCAWKCRHHKCTQMCSEICNRPPCNEPCRKTLKCTHPCVGLCGEPCPPKCRVCHRDELTEIFFGNEDEPDSRFVVLEDCGHIFEVGGLDRWVDSAPDEGAAQHVQQKVCPKCATPIQGSPRYNNIIKARQQHIEEIKRKVQGSERELQAGKTALLDTLASVQLASHYFTQEALRRKVERSSSLQSLRSWENTMNFLQSTQRLKKQAEECGQERRRRLIGWAEAVEAWLGRREGDTFSAQQLKECRNEIGRISYLANIFVRLSSYETQLPDLPALSSAAVDEALQLLSPQKPFTDADEELLQATLEKIDALLPASGMRLSEAERVSVVEAMDFGKGHWYKCPKGHLYTIGECGRAMEESRCPECGAAIGGGQHRLNPSNAAADEILNPVEGATEHDSRLSNIVELTGLSDRLALPRLAPATPSPQLGSPSSTISSPKEAGTNPLEQALSPSSPLASPGSPSDSSSSLSCIQHAPTITDTNCPSVLWLPTHQPHSPPPPVKTCPGPASSGEENAEEYSPTGSAAPEAPSTPDGDSTSTVQLQTPVRALVENQEPPEMIHQAPETDSPPPS